MTAPPLPALSDRQKQILRLRAEGLSGPQIARVLHLAVGTVAYHEEVIVTRLQARNVTNAVHLAWQVGLLRRERHGDHAGFRAHERRGEDPWACPECAPAELAYHRAMAAKRRAATARKESA